jgi:hypothetical protein
MNKLTVVKEAFQIIAYRDIAWTNNNLTRSLSLYYSG